MTDLYEPRLQNPIKLDLAFYCECRHQGGARQLGLEASQMPIADELERRLANELQGLLRREKLESVVRRRVIEAQPASLPSSPQPTFVFAPRDAAAAAPRGSVRVRAADATMALCRSACGSKETVDTSPGTLGSHAPVRSLSASKLEIDRAIALNSMLGSKLLQELTSSSLQQIARQIEMVCFTPGEIVTSEGDAGDCAFIVAEGELRGVSKSGFRMANVGAGAIIGELSAIYETRRPLTVSSVGHSRVWRLNRLDVTRAVRADERLRARELFEILRSAGSLAGLDDDDIWRLADVSEVVSFTAGAVVYAEGDEGDAMYAVKSGMFVVTTRAGMPARAAGAGAGGADASAREARPSFLGAISMGDYFGERALLTNAPHASTVHAVGDSVCLKIKRADFQLLVGEVHKHLEARLAVDSADACAHAASPAPRAGGERADADGARAETSPDAAGVVQREESADDARVEPHAAAVARARAPANASGGVTALSVAAWRAPPQEELTIVKPLGCGASGAVALVEHAPSTRLFALKVINKSRLTRPAHVARVRTEKDALLACCNHPCIMQLYATYQDEGSLCMLIEPCCGGELHSLIRDNGRLSEPSARFYAAAAALALRHVHECGFIYRDLKPENLMIDAQGFPRLCDFGLARRVVDSGRAYSSVGTLEYMAPEVIRRSGHSYAADWWSLGVLLFEMLVGRTPFMPTHAKSESQLDHEESAMQLMRDVMACRIYWPDDATDEHSLSAESRDLISKLLKVNLSERLGYAGDERSGANDVINHPWFNDINMVAIMMRTMAPPYRPELDSPTDTSCFDVDLAEFSLKLRADRSASAPTFDSSLFDDW